MFGFHRQDSVDHMHLHCLSLPCIPRWKGFKYVPLGWLDSYVSADTAMKYLDSPEFSKAQCHSKRNLKCLCEAGEFQHLGFSFSGPRHNQGSKQLQLKPCLVD
ncbi:hypothetical protein BDL97_20G003300 [Sphagnum fallax]|nr:hypothetical protein BDL97_20G003300 [Sphagnum fallax]